MSTYKAAENLAISETGFMFLPGTGETFTSNEIGKTIIHLLQKGESQKKIIDKITNEYDVEPNTFEKDFTDFINQLTQYNLVSEV
jgi:Coenzyme PQQ synthesis protein D (PqqD)